MTTKELVDLYIKESMDPAYSKQILEAKCRPIIQMIDWYVSTKVREARERCWQDMEALLENTVREAFQTINGYPKGDK